MPTVIKAGSSAASKRRFATVDLADHLREARAVVDAARREAARIRAQAKQDAERSRVEAAEIGHGEGFVRGTAEGKETGHQQAYEESTARFHEEQSSLTAALTAVVESLEQRKDDIAIAARRDVLELAVAIASKLTFRIGTLHCDAANANLERAVELVGRRTNLTVYANPRDVDTMRAFGSLWHDDLVESSAVKWIEDESVAPGGCRVTSDLTDVDATLDTQVAEMVGLLLGDGETNA